jgi:peptide/nickel transport system permease protein
VIGAVILCTIAAVALAADLAFPTDPLRIVATPEIWPLTQWSHPLGTDSLGRDIAAMIAHGARATCSSAWWRPPPPPCWAWA